MTKIEPATAKIHSTYIILIVILGLLILLRESCNRIDKDQLVKDITSYSDSVKFERLKNGALISTNTSLKLESQEQMRILASNLGDTVKQMIDKFKSLSNVTYVTNKFYAGKDTIKLETQIPCDFKPFKVRRGTPKTYAFVGTIAKDYFSIDSLSIHDTTTLVFGRKKIGFMKHDYAVDINHSNELMKSTNIKDYKYNPKKKWYERTWVHALVGAAGYVAVKEVAIPAAKNYIPTIR